MEYNIVIPFDFSEQSSKIIATADEVCKHVNAALFIIHVVPAEASEETVRKTETRLNTVTSGLTCGNVQRIVRQGTVGGQVLQFVSGLKNAVLFLSASEDVETRPTYIGPNAQYIVANSPVPVLLLKNGVDMKSANTVLVPIDLELENKLKLTYTLFLSRFFDRALIRLLAVVYDTDDFGLHRQMQRLNKFTAFLEKTGVNCVGEIVRCYEEDGETYSKVAVDYADKSEAQLVLIVTNDEKCESGCGISCDADFMLSNFRSNILSVTPFAQ